jgi:putative transposase
VRARTRLTKGPGSKDGGLAMVFKLLEAAEQRWRAVNGPHLVALVRAGARFEKGKLVERPKEAPEEEQRGRRVIMRGRRPTGFDDSSPSPI